MDEPRSVRRRRRGGRSLTSGEHAAALGDIGRPRIRLPWLLSGLAAGNLLVALCLNKIVLTDRIYRSMWSNQGSSAQIEALLATMRHWETIGYLIGPLSLLARIGLTALLVQLTLLLFGPRTPLRHVFRAATWAQLPLVLGAAAQLLWLGLLPAAARTADAIQTAPFTVLGILEQVSVGPGWELLLGRVSLFDVGWIALFALALEDARRVPLRVAGMAVSTTWVFLTLLQWAGWLYLSRI